MAEPGAGWEEDEGDVMDYEGGAGGGVGGRPQQQPPAPGAVPTGGPPHPPSRRGVDKQLKTPAQKQALEIMFAGPRTRRVGAVTLPPP